MCILYLKDLGSRLELNEEGDYVRGNGRADWLQRMGLARPPKTLRELWYYTVTHKVNFLTLVLHKQVVLLQSSQE